MWNLKRLTALVLTAVFLAGLAATAAAQEESAPDASGTLVGDVGGAYQTWNVTLPADQDVTLTLTHWPCDIGMAVGLNVWGPSGKLASSSHSDSCTEKAWFNTGDGGQAEIQLYDYLHGIGTWWSVAASGISLGAAPAPAAMDTSAEMTSTSDTSMADESMAATSEETAAGETSMAADTTMAGEESMAGEAAMAAPTSGDSTINATDTLFGDSGGAFDNYNLTVEEGKTYTVEMTVGTDAGGNWPGIGFDVWGPSGMVAQGTWMDNDTVSATFTADGNVVYLIQPYNYHHGLMAFYSLEAAAAQ